MTSEIAIEGEASLEASEPRTRSSDFVLSEMLQDSQLQIEFSSIPDRMGFRIGEVSQMLGLATYVLRFWETEFDQLRPKKAGNNQRIYSRKDVELAYVIRKLLHRDRFSIEGAKAVLKGTLNSARAVHKEVSQAETVKQKRAATAKTLEHLLVQIRRARAELLFAN